MSEAEIAVTVEVPDRSDVVALLAEARAYSFARYPAPSNHRLPIEGLLSPNVTFFVARRNGEALGAAALYRSPEGIAELKSLIVAERARGKGLGRRLVESIVTLAAKEGYATVMLETGIYSHEALTLYERCGFARRNRFGSYADDPLSVFMEHRLQ
jgi:putative acetyltransferase